MSHRRVWQLEGQEFNATAFKRAVREVLACHPNVSGSVSAEPRSPDEVAAAFFVSVETDVGLGPDIAFASKSAWLILRRERTADGCEVVSVEALGTPLTASTIERIGVEIIASLRTHGT